MKGTAPRERLGVPTYRPYRGGAITETTHLGHPDVCDDVAVTGGVLRKKLRKHAKKSQRRKLTLAVEVAGHHRAEIATATATR
jgi:hypothetical protein